MYRPLKPYLTIKDSPIEGLGLFATEFIPKDTDFGVSHIMAGGVYVRTPLGGFINHSERPNVVKELTGETLNIVSIRDIEAGDEILLKYTLYSL